jgi:hypothetical protein
VPREGAPEPVCLHRGSGARSCERARPHLGSCERSGLPRSAGQVAAAADSGPRHARSRGSGPGGLGHRAGCEKDSARAVLQAFDLPERGNRKCPLCS